MTQTMEMRHTPEVDPQGKKVKLTCKGVWHDGTITWSLDANENDPPSGKIAEIKVTKAQSPCEVTIKLKISDGPDVTFDPERPLSASSSACPGKGSGITTDEIDPASVEVKDNGKTLKFVDLNLGPPNEVHYALNFIGTDPLDPIIRNRL